MYQADEDQGLWAWMKSTVLCICLHIMLASGLAKTFQRYPGYTFQDGIDKVAESYSLWLSGFHHLNPTQSEFFEMIQMLQSSSTESGHQSQVFDDAYPDFVILPYLMQERVTRTEGK
jgi:hypothetical protein